MTDDALREIRAIRSRLAQLEQLAQAATTEPTAGAPPMDMESALAGHYNPTEPAPDRERARLESIARGFAPDAASEDALRQRAKDPAAFDAAQRAMHADGLALALYGHGRDAAITLGRFDPTKEGTK
ncbi:MAG: hypothetical protein ABSB75_02225 [Candidatus Limnocylindrales bacterium]